MEKPEYASSLAKAIAVFVLILTRKAIPAQISAKQKGGRSSALLYFYIPNGSILF